MRHVSATEAKANFSELLSDVARGETVTITRHGKIVASLRPVEDADKLERQNAIESLKDWHRDRQDVRPVSVEDLLAMRDEGRRF